ncbi:MAG: Fe-S cluster assembly ATPase SufC [Patescibacteria group bacterium]
MPHMLEVQHFSAHIDEKKILQDVSLAVAPGEVHFLMGPNGSGKTTLASALMGNPVVVPTGGTIIFNGEDITTALPEERAKKGLYLGFQYPVEVQGVGFVPFLRAALSARGMALPSEQDFRAELVTAGVELGVASALIDRNLNEGFSGGEKKRSELLQLSVIQPRLAVLDEFDSGLDIDGLRSAARALKKYVTPDTALLLITHYGRMAEYLPPDRVHIMQAGTIVKSGGTEIIEAVERGGFDGFLSLS